MLLNILIIKKTRALKINQAVLNSTPFKSSSSASAAAERTEPEDSALQLCTETPGADVISVQVIKKKKVKVTKGFEAVSQSLKT